MDGQLDSTPSTFSAVDASLSEGGEPVDAAPAVTQTSTPHAELTPPPGTMAGIAPDQGAATVPVVKPIVSAATGESVSVERNTASQAERQETQEDSPAIPEATPAALLIESTPLVDAGDVFEHTALAETSMDADPSAEEGIADPLIDEPEAATAVPTRSPFSRRRTTSVSQRKPRKLTVSLRPEVEQCMRPFDPGWGDGRGLPVRPLRPRGAWRYEERDLSMVSRRGRGMFIERSQQTPFVEHSRRQMERAATMTPVIAKQLLKTPGASKGPTEADGPRFLTASWWSEEAAVDSAGSKSAHTGPQDIVDQRSNRPGGLPRFAVAQSDDKMWTPTVSSVYSAQNVRPRAKPRRGAGALGEEHNEAPLLGRQQQSSSDGSELRGPRRKWGQSNLGHSLQSQEQRADNGSHHSCCGCCCCCRRHSPSAPKEISGACSCGCFHRCTIC